MATRKKKSPQRGSVHTAPGGHQINNYHKEEEMKLGKLVILVTVMMLFVFGLVACQKRAVTKADTAQQEQPQTMEKKDQ